MSRLRPMVVCAVAVLALCACTASATAKTPKLSPVADCKAHNGTLTQHYTSAELKQALGTISASVKEYTTCYATITNQLEKQLGVQNINGGKGSGGSGGGGSGTLILVIVIVVVVLAGGGGAFWAYRRNQASGGTPA